MGRLDGQTAIVTGFARGIGCGVAARLAADGCRVIGWDIAPELFDPREAGFEPRAVCKVDVSDLAQAKAAFVNAMAKVGRIEIMVNNAGVNGPVKPVWEYCSDEWDRVVAVNMTGVFNCCHAVIQHMRDNGYGRIVNVASIAGKEGVPFIAPYSASKAGVIAFSKALAKEVVQDGVTVNCIASAMAETELMREMTPEHIASMKAKIPMGRFVRIDEIAEMVAFVASPKCSFTTGFTFDLTGGRATY
ncbi:MAG: SDR family NAD(P)-dependent oxidoreductase [Beijerinckiaceae bacterium]